MAKKLSKRTNDLLNIYGTLLLSIGILAIINSLYLQNPSQIFWMCYISLILMGIGILIRNSFLVMSQVYILAIPVAIWDIDFLYQLLTQQPLLGLTDYFFQETTTTLSNIITLQHLFAVPLAIYCVHKIGRVRNDGWKISFVQITLNFMAVSVLTARDLNINCVFNPCVNIKLGFPYEVTWFLIFFTMTFLSAIIINKLPWLKVHKPKKD